MVDGEIPADVVLRTNRVLAFRDINPQAPTHVLVIPQNHHATIGALAEADPALLGAPTGHVLPVREVRLSAGAGFIVVICGEVMTMPGLPRSPAAERIHLDAEGRIEGLF